MKKIVSQEEKLPLKLRKRLIKIPEISGIYRENKVTFSLDAELSIDLALYGKRKSSLGIIKTNFSSIKNYKKASSFFLKQKWFDGRSLLITIFPYRKNALSGSFDLKII